MDLREKVYESVDGIHLCQNANQRQALVDTVRNLCFHAGRAFLDYLSYC